MAVHTAKVTSVNSSASSVTLASSNPGRRGMIIENTDANVVYVKYGTTATSSDFTFSLSNGSKYEMPLSSLYTGRIDAIWAADGSGAAKVTEW